LSCCQTGLSAATAEPNGRIVNHTSVGSVCSIPFQAAYNASKAAMAAFANTQRLELAPFGITDVEIKTGGAQSNFLKNKHLETKEAILPEDSIYQLAKAMVERVLRGEDYKQWMQPAEQWAKNVVSDLLRKRPPPVVWRGYNAGIIRLMTLLRVTALDRMVTKMTKLDVVEEAVRA
jgi:1-acylglycerone phosphate reductase